ncbi:MAG: Benzoate transport protein [uncultured Solirubrobacteraceae bacterium]|uniref:Benzoate transport protein n=1 Tax=uncultured Solirubrobacteraceae bacterium TaxID=1162706 RepID=A0A6J4RFK2_9ACTN|nr:MAG: Benzoate transport protein [uncultured Solirubrobacteraceae bacterium]
MRGASQPVLAGLVTALVGFAGAFTVVLAGLRGAGATAEQAASGLLALCVTMGLCSIVLGLRLRMPVAMAWSTPGAALLASSGPPDGGWPAAVGAFVVCGILLVLTGFWRPLGRAIAAIPAPLAAAMLAGVLLPLCLAPARAAAELPWQGLPVVLVWAVLALTARRWAVPGAVVAAAVVVALDPAGPAPSAGDLVPVVALTAPVLEAGALVGLALPLFLVTMASQNVPGMSVLASFGFRPDLRPILVSTGAATIAGAPLGGHAVNLAAITAALTAGPEAGPDPDRRWIASVAAGAAHIAMGLGAGAATALVATAPALLVEAVAGLALLGALASALATAMGSAAHRDAAIACLAVSASGITVLGISAPFWGLVAGLALWAAGRRLAGRPGAAPEGARGASSSLGEQKATLVGSAMTSEGSAGPAAPR